MVAMTSGSTPWRIIGSTSSILNSSAEQHASTPRMPTMTATQNGAPSMPIAGQHEERRQHDELALGEVDGLRGLPQQREADRDQRVDRPGRKPRDEKLEEIAHRPPPMRAAGASAPAAP